MLVNDSNEMTITTRGLFIGGPPGSIRLEPAFIYQDEVMESREYIRANYDSDSTNVHLLNWALLRT